MTDISLATVGLSAGVSVITGYVGTLINYGRLQKRDRRVFGLSLLAEVKFLQRTLRRYYHELEDTGPTEPLTLFPPLCLTAASTSVFSTGAGRLGLFGTRTAVEVIEFYGTVHALAGRAKHMRESQQEACADQEAMRKAASSQLQMLKHNRHHSFLVVMALHREIPPTSREVVRFCRRRGWMVARAAWNRLGAGFWKRVTQAKA